jgi:modification methylase
MTSNLKFLNTIINKDCTEALKLIEDNSIDLIFADPPYNLQLKNELFRPNNSKVDGVNDNWDKFSSFAEYDNFTTKWLVECQRVLKTTGTIWVIGSYHNIFRVGAIMQNIGFWILNDVVWVKSNPMPNFLGKRLANAHETMIWAKKSELSKGYKFNYQGLKTINNGKQMRSDWFLEESGETKPQIFGEALCGGSERLRDENGQKLHSTQKPLKLIERIILGCSDEGDVVLDPFGGSGTTASACQKHNRNYILIEKEEKYTKIATERLLNEKKHTENDIFFEKKSILNLTENEAIIQNLI